LENEKIAEIERLYGELAQERVKKIQFASSVHQIQKESGGEGPRLGKARMGLVLAETRAQEIEAAIEGLEVSLVRFYITSDFRLPDEALAEVRV